jgi:hypothetical protein
MNWQLRGARRTRESGRQLGFTWSWEHNTLPERVVDVAFEPHQGDGTRLAAQHGFYTNSAEDVEDRNSHVAGRLHLLG